jgi:hypothetical protein
MWLGVGIWGLIIVVLILTGHGNLANPWVVGILIGPTAIIAVFVSTAFALTPVTRKLLLTFANRGAYRRRAFFLGVTLFVVGWLFQFLATFAPSRGADLEDAPPRSIHAGASTTALRD